MRRQLSAALVFALLIVAGCGTPNPLYCDSDADCRNPNLSFCDLGGVHPASDGVRHTCIATPTVLDVTVKGPGTIVSQPAGIDCGTDCSQSYVRDTLVALSAVPNPGALLVEWSGTCAGQAECVVTMDASKSVSAVFAASRTLDVQLTGPASAGTVTSVPTGISCPGTCSANFGEGTSVVLSAMPAPEGVFLGWSGSCAGVGDCVVSMDADVGVGGELGLSGDVLWRRQVTGTGFVSVQGVATNTDGAVFEIGSFVGSVSLDGTPLTSAGGSDVFVSKRSAKNGSLVWVKSFGGSGDDGGLAIAVDSAGDVVVCGGLVGSTVFGGTSLAGLGGSDAFVAKLDGGDGSVTWVQRHGGSGDDRALAVAVDPTGNVLAAGTFVGTGNFGGTDLSRPGGTETDTFIAKYSAGGTHLWSKDVRASNFVFAGVFAQAVVSDSAGDVTVAGVFAGRVIFGPLATGSSNSDSSDIFVSKYAAADGTHLWTRQFGGPGTDAASGLARGPGDTLAVIGRFSGTVAFGGGPLQSVVSDGFLFELSPAGAHLFSRTLCGTASTGCVGSAVANDGAGGFVAVGSYSNTANFGTGQLPSAGVLDVFVARFSAVDGANSWAHRFGGGSFDRAHAVAASPGVRVVVGGRFRGLADFGGVSLTSAGGDDAFVVSIAP